MLLLEVKLIIIFIKNSPKVRICALLFKGSQISKHVWLLFADLNIVNQSITIYQQFTSKLEVTCHFFSTSVKWNYKNNVFKQVYLFC